MVGRNWFFCVWVCIFEILICVGDVMSSVEDWKVFISVCKWYIYEILVKKFCENFGKGFGNGVVVSCEWCVNCMVEFGVMWCFC